MFIISLETRGFPVIFQKRIGRNEVSFTCIKLRTFIVGSEIVATHEALSNQMTQVGRIIRPLHLDELPQVWNVLTGDMSFVGYRPCLPFMEDVINARNALNVHQFRPGITGIAQLERVDMRFPEKLARLDALYIQHKSLMLDLQIGVSTVFPLLWQRWRHHYLSADLLN